MREGSPPGSKRVLAVKAEPMAEQRERVKVRAEVRAQLVEVVKAWGEQRGVDVKELLFRLRTATIKHCG